MKEFFNYLITEKSEKVKIILIAVAFFSFIIFLVWKQEPTPNNEIFNFRATHIGNKFDLKHVLMTEAEVLAVLNCDRITVGSKEKVTVGGWVSVTGGGWTFVDKQSVVARYNIFPLAETNEHDFTTGYKFIANFYSEYKSPAKMQLIENKGMIENIKLAKNLGTISEIQRLQIGRYLARNTDGTYYITSSKNMALTPLTRSAEEVVFTKEMLLAKYLETNNNL